jgi:hypothetical protein
LHLTNEPCHSGWQAQDAHASRKVLKFMNITLLKHVFRRYEALAWVGAILAFTLLSVSIPLAAQDQDDPPGRVARLGYLEGSVSFQPAGESEWVEAVPNRPMTTGDKVWADRDSRAEVQLGSATINLAPNTGFSFLNLDDRTIQIQLSSGSINVRVWNLDRDNVFEVDTANQAFSIYQPGRYRLDASEDGSNTVVTIREGQGESTGNGQSYTMHSGQRFIFSGTTSLNAEVEEIGGPDDFDRWADGRERRYQDSPSARYCSQRVVGFQDLDDNGDWQPSPDYGYVWYPRVAAGWAPYHDGHWAWIDPWGWTWVDDARWGYAPFHYGRWAVFGGRWGWIPGPREERPVYAPALVAFVGGGFAAGATVAWFPLGPREVYVPSYRVSPAYVNRVNVTNTTVNVTQVTNVYNTTIVNNNTTINNVTYVNRNVRGGVTAMPQRDFASAQPVSRTAVAVNQQELARTSVVSRAAVPPVREAVMGPHTNTANRVAMPPQTVANRAVIAKATAPPPPPSFAARQQVYAQHPGQPVGRQQLQQLRPANAPASPLVRQAPPAKAATPTPASSRPSNQPMNQPGNPVGNTRPAGNTPPAAQPTPGNQPAGNNRPGTTRPFELPARNDRPSSAQPNNQPQPAQPQPNQARPNQPLPNQPQPNQPQPNRPQMNQLAPNNRPENNAPTAPSNNRPPSAQPNNRPEPNQPRPNQPMPENRPTPQQQPQNTRPTPPLQNDRYRPPEQPRTDQPRNDQPRDDQAQPRNDRPQAPPQNARPQPAPENRPAQQQQQQPQQRPQPKQTPEEKKRQDEQNKQKPQ